MDKEKVKSFIKQLKEIKKELKQFKSPLFIFSIIAQDGNNDKLIGPPFLNPEFNSNSWIWNRLNHSQRVFNHGEFIEYTDDYNINSLSDQEKIIYDEKHNPIAIFIKQSLTSINICGPWSSGISIPPSNNFIEIINRLVYLIVNFDFGESELFNIIKKSFWKDHETCTTFIYKFGNIENLKYTGKLTPDWNPAILKDDQGMIIEQPVGLMECDYNNWLLFLLKVATFKMSDIKLTSFYWNGNRQIMINGYNDLDDFFIHLSQEDKKASCLILGDSEHPSNLYPISNLVIQLIIDELKGTIKIKKKNKKEKQNVTNYNINIGGDNNGDISQGDNINKNINIISYAELENLLIKNNVSKSNLVTLFQHKNNEIKTKQWISQYLTIQNAVEIGNIILQCFGFKCD